MARKGGSWLRKYRLTILLILAVTAVGTSTYIQQLGVAHDLSAEADRQEEELKGLYREVDRLRTEYDAVNTAEHIEKMAREKLKMVKPNEIIYIIKDQE
jgi:cell division protein FtsB